MLSMEEPYAGVDSNSVASEPVGVCIKALCDRQFSQGPGFRCRSQNLENDMIDGYPGRTQRHTSQRPATPMNFNS